MESCLNKQKTITHFIKCTKIKINYQSFHRKEYYSSPPPGKNKELKELSMKFSFSWW